MSVKKFAMGMAAGLVLYMLTKSFWVILAVVLFVGILDKLNEDKKCSADL